MLATFSYLSQSTIPFSWTRRTFYSEEHVCTVKAFDSLRKNSISTLANCDYSNTVSFSKPTPSVPSGIVTFRSICKMRSWMEARQKKRAILQLTTSHELAKNMFNGVSRQVTRGEVRPKGANMKAPVKCAVK